MVLRNIKKISSMNLFQTKIVQIKVSGMVSQWQPIKNLTCGGADLVLKTVLTGIDKLAFQIDISRN